MDKITLHSSLPFTDTTFYGFLICSVLITLLLKLFFKQSSKLFLWWIFLISFSYCLFLYPNPERILIFVAYGFMVYKISSIKNKLNDFWSIFIYIFPLLLMKLFNVLPELKSDVKTFLQISGISYMTFKMLQIHFDHRSSPKISFLRYFTFMAFPPSLLIGPIDRYERFNADIDQGFNSVNQETFLKGLDFLLLGILFKYILAVALDQLVLTHIVVDNKMIYHLSYMYTYLLYLFFDFAGYSLLAMGAGYLLGIRLPQNFNKPFLALNPKEFWQRWHKSLGDWLNDYFFKPILKYFTTQKMFSPIQRQSLALLLTFTLMGAWNGFELHFVVSGVLFGIYSVIHNYYQVTCRKKGYDVFFGNMNPTWVRILSIAIMFNAVSFSIYIFSGKLF